MFYETIYRYDCRQGRSFTTLMALYERNYAYLAKLVPALRELEDRTVSRVEGSPDLHLHILERSRFTTTLSLTYLFAMEDGRLAPDPGLQVRVYHDARLAEAMASRYRPGLGSMPPGCVAKLPILDWRWEINLFFEKWLTYCLGQGHGFVRGAERTLCGEGDPALAGT